MNPQTKKLIKFFGSQVAVAKHFGISRQAVLLWQRAGIPVKHALEIEQITHGEISAMEVLRGQPKSSATTP